MPFLRKKTHHRSALKRTFRPTCTSDYLDHEPIFTNIHFMPFHFTHTTHMNVLVHAYLKRSRPRKEFITTNLARPRMLLVIRDGGVYYSVWNVWKFLRLLLLVVNIWFDLSSCVLVAGDLVIYKIHLQKLFVTQKVRYFGITFIFFVDYNSIKMPFWRLLDP